MAREDLDAKGLQQLKSDLKSGNFSRLYFFYGEERYLQEHYFAMLRKKLVSGPMEEFNYRRIAGEHINMDALRDAVEAVPMMADMVLVQVDDCNPFLQPEEIRNQLSALFSDIPDTCCVVFYFDTVPYSRDGRLKKMTEAVDKYAVEVEFGRQGGAALNEWISRHFRQHEKTISPDLCQYLAFLTGSSMTALDAEIGKVAAYSRMTAITRQDIDAVVEPVLTAAVFDITDALAGGNYDLALEKLRHIIGGKEEQIGVAAAVGAHFRRLLMAKTVLTAGQGVDAVQKLLATGSEYYARKTVSQAGRVSEQMCCRAVELCFETDCMLKRNVGDGAVLLETLLLQLAQEARA